jgi:Putative beta-barrel porin 2
VAAVCPYLIAIILCLPGFFAHLNAQDLSLTRPGSLTLFRPFSYANEGNFTSLPFRISSYAKAGYDDNALLRHAGLKGSVYNEFGLSAGVNVGDRSTELNGGLLAGVVAYWQRPGKKIDPDLHLNLAFDHQFSERTVFSLASAISYQAQPDISSGVGSPNFVGNLLYAQNKISLGMQWTPRIAAFTSYSLNLLHYDSRAEGWFQDRLEHLVSEEIRYLLRSEVVAAGEYRFGHADYLHNGLANSYSHYFLAGSDVSFSARLKFSFRAGAELRHLKQPSQHEILYPYAESNLTFLYRPESTIDWYNRYGLEEPDISQPAYRKTFRTGLKVVHRIGGNAKAIAAGYYAHNEYPSLFTENLAEANLEIEYQITRKLRLNAGYTFTRDFSNMISRDYIRNRFYSGVSYVF